MLKRLLISVIIAFTLVACGKGSVSTPVIESPKSQAKEQTATTISQITQSQSNTVQNKAQSSLISSQSDTAQSSSEETTMTSMLVTVQGKVFTASLAKNNAVDALMKMLQSDDITINMSDYAGFEKIGSLGTSLPTSDSQITTQSGDIVMYNSNQIVLFYGSNSWSYTKLGKIDDLKGWSDALGNGDVMIKFSLS